MPLDATHRFSHLPRNRARAATFEVTERCTKLFNYAPPVSDPNITLAGLVRSVGSGGGWRGVHEDVPGPVVQFIADHVGIAPNEVIGDRLRLYRDENLNAAMAHAMQIREAL